MLGKERSYALRYYGQSERNYRAYKAVFGFDLRYKRKDDRNDCKHVEHDFYYFEFGENTL